MNTPTTPTIQTAPGTVPLTEYTIATVHELLATCEEFFRTAGPAVHAELRAYLDHHTPPADPSWLIDMLGFSALHLGRELPAQTPRPAEYWQPAAGPVITPVTGPVIGPVIGQEVDR